MAGKIQGGGIDDDTVISAVDLMPTLCAIAGAEVPQGKYLPDGENMEDVWQSEPRDREKPLMWEYHFEMDFGHVIHKNPMMAIRSGDWKLLMNPDKSRVELYNIPDDPTELNNLAAANPSVVESLSKQLLEWHKSMPSAPIPEKAGTNDYPWPSRN